MRARNVGFHKGKLKTFQSVFSLEVLEHLIVYTLAVLQSVRDHYFTNV